MAAALVQSRSAQTTSGAGSLALAFSSNVTAGNAIIVGGASWQMTFGAQSNSTTGVCTDSRTHAYSRAGGESANTNAHAAIYYSQNITSGACTVTLDPTGSANDITIILSEWSGMHTTAMFDVAKPASGDATSVGAGTSTGGGVMTSGTTASTAEANELLIAVFGHEGSTAAVTAGAGYTSPAGMQQTGASHMPAMMEYQTGAGVGTKSATCTWVASAAYASSIAAFKEAAAGGGVVGPLLGGHLVGGGILAGRLVR